jgi:hypothetical protein
MKHIHIVVALILTANVCPGQHMDDIRKKLYPKFSVADFESRFKLNPFDYDPTNPDSMEVNPKWYDYEEAFEGFHVIDFYYKQRRRELLASSGAEKEKISHELDAWMEKTHAECNKIWKAEENGYRLMTLQYMYCLTSKLKDKVKSMGGGFPANLLLDKQPTLDQYKIGSPRSAFSDLVELATEENQIYFTPKDSAQIAGIKGEAKLRFHNDKLHSVNLRFECCATAILNYLQKSFGGHTLKSSDPITTYEYRHWRGNQYALTAHYYGDSNTLSLFLSAR